MNATHEDKLFVWATGLANAVQCGDMEKMLEMANLLASHVTDEDIAKAKEIANYLGNTEGYSLYTPYLKGQFTFNPGADSKCSIADPFNDSFPEN